MWYTHYWWDLELENYSDELISIFNQAYQDFLRSWVTIDWRHINLFSVFMNKDEDEDTLDLHFHEWTVWASWQPLLFWEDRTWTFCKTARKSYDVAVVLTLCLAALVLNKSYSSDWTVITTFNQIRTYIEKELHYSTEYDLDQLESLFDLWLNKCIAFSEEIQEIEDERQYSSVGDLPDTELEYIAENIKKWNTCIYLNNWQVVLIRFE